MTAKLRLAAIACFSLALALVLAFASRQATGAPIIQYASVIIRTGAPTAGSGYQAATGSIYVDRTTRIVYVKNSSAATDWAVVGGTSSTPTFSTITINTTGLGTPGESALFSTKAAASTDGDNIWIGGGGQSVAYDGANAFSGSKNTSLGYASLNANTTGYGNTAVGAAALILNTTGVFNTALGVSTLIANTTGDVNTAVGDAALQANTTGDYNVGVGANALFSNTTGVNNVAVGHDSLSQSTTGNYITSVGDTAMLFHQSGDYDTALGSFALKGGTTSNHNTSLGAASMFGVTTGAYNTAAGYGALINGTGANYVSAIGASALPDLAMTGDNFTTAVGYGTGGGITTGVNNTIIGSRVTGLAAGTSNTVILADGAGNQVLTAVGTTLAVTVPGALNGYTQVTQAADQDVTNAGLTDSNTLTVAVTAGKIYAIDAFLVVGGNDTTGDYIFDFAVAAGTMNCTGTEQSVTTADAIQNTTVIATAADNTADTSVGTRADASLPIAVRVALACKVSNTTTFKYRFGNAVAAGGRVSRTMAGSFLKWKQLN
jgi:hypothetical protein